MSNKLVVDCNTGQVALVPLTEQELLEAEKARITMEALRAEEEAEAEAKKQAKESALAKLTTLGLSETEAKAIIGA